MLFELQRVHANEGKISFKYLKPNLNPNHNLNPNPNPNTNPIPNPNLIHKILVE